MVLRLVLCVSLLPLLASPLPTSPPVSENDDFMANWMGSLMPAIGNFTVLDISMPGTHDTVREDLHLPLAPTLIL